MADVGSCKGRRGQFLGQNGVGRLLFVPGVSGTKPNFLDQVEIDTEGFNIAELFIDGQYFGIVDNVVTVAVRPMMRAYGNGRRPADRVLSLGLVARGNGSDKEILPGRLGAEGDAIGKAAWTFRLVQPF